jgi:hypothetical protein
MKTKTVSPKALLAALAAAGTLGLLLVPVAAGQSVVGSLQVGNSLTGVNQSDAAATYNFQIGSSDASYNSTFFASCTISASSISTFTPAALLSAIYANLEGQLATQYQSDLTLNLTDDTLSFAFPSSIADPTISAYSTDAGLASDGGLSYVLGIATITSSDPTYTISPLNQVGGFLNILGGINISVDLGGNGGNSVYSGTTAATGPNGTVSASDIANALNNLANGAGQTANMGAGVVGGTDTVVFDAPAGTIVTVPGANVQLDAAPEPSTLALLGGGAGLLAGVLHRRRRRG